MRIKNQQLLKKITHIHFMPSFIDGHHVGESRLEEIKNMVSTINEFGVSTLDMFYNKNEQELYCILEAPNEDAIKMHHAKINLTCDFITPVKKVHTQSAENTEKLRTIGELAARIAHDLRNPLSVIKNTVEIMENKQKLRIEERVIYYSRLHRAIERISHQIEDVLDFVRPVSLNFEKHLVNEILGSTLDKIVKPDTIKIIMPSNFVYAVCDSTRLEIVFTNLIVNAIQAMNNSGQVNIDLFDEESVVLIKISDTGSGIPQDILPQIFEPLFTTKQTGTGLGLASCKKIIEQHHGTINATSTVGNGTTFTITLSKSEIIANKIKQLA